MVGYVVATAFRLPGREWVTIVLMCSQKAASLSLSLVPLSYLARTSLVPLSLSLSRTPLSLSLSSPSLSVFLLLLLSLSLCCMFPLKVPLQRHAQPYVVSLARSVLLALCRVMTPSFLPSP